MSDYQNSDTAKWDAQEVRKQTSSGQGPKPKKKRRLGSPGYLAGGCVASFRLAGIGWLAANDACALNMAPLTATIEVESGDSVGTVATKLKKAGLINSKLLFMITSPVFHASRYIQPGVYELNTDMDFNCLIKSMQPTGGVAATVTVPIPEGYPVAQIIPQPMRAYFIVLSPAEYRRFFPPRGRRRTAGRPGRCAARQRAFSEYRFCPAGRADCGYRPLSPATPHDP